MNLAQQTKELCRIYEIHPQRSRGQNFLITEEIYDEIIEAANLSKADTVLEVGPGLGFLTEKLAAQVKKVVTVELDAKLAEVLKIKLIANKIENVEVVLSDVLDYRMEAKKYKIVANLPYNITSIFLRKFLSSDNPPDSMVLMLQKEVAERIVAQPGAMSMLAVSVQFYATAEIINEVKATNFYPAPEVDSAIIKIVSRPAPLPSKDVKNFFRLVKGGFVAKRKMLKNNLAGSLHISQPEAEKLLIETGLNPKARAQELSLSDWLNLFAKAGKFML